MYVCMYVCMYIYIYIYMYMFIRRRAKLVGRVICEAATAKPDRVQQPALQKNKH